MTLDTGGGPEPEANDLLPRRPAQDGQRGGRPDSQHGRQPLGAPGQHGRQPTGAPGAALSVLDTRLIDDWGRRLVAVIRRGGRLLVAGTGGSAAQAELFAAQFTGRGTVGRRDRPAIALPGTPLAVTAIASGGSGPGETFARQVRAYGRPGDVLLTMSTSGQNHSLLRAVTAARAGGIVAWCLTGPAPNPLADACDEAVCVYPAGARALSLTATVQAAHQAALNLIWLSFDAAVNAALNLTES